MTAGAIPSSKMARAARVTMAFVVAGWFLLPLLAVLSFSPIAPSFATVVAVLVLLSALRPGLGMSALIVVMPCAILVQHASGHALLAGDIVDGFVLSFVAGASLRLFASEWPAYSRLAGPAALFATVILTSAVVELRTLQLVTPRDPLLPDLLHYVTQDYWTEVREFPVVRAMFRWLAWLVMAVCVERMVARDHGTARTRLREWFIAGVLGALIAVYQMFDVVRGLEQPFWTAMADVWQHVRLSALQPDVNAAGSYLLLFVVPAVIVGVAYRSRWLLGACLPLLLVAVGLTRSRAAISAGVAVLCAAGLAHLWRQRERGRAIRRRVVLAGVVIALGISVLVGAYYGTTSSNAAFSDAARIRLDLATTGLEALKRNPVFGVGLADYIRSTRRFMTPDMTLLRAMAPQGENAHNNFLQIAVELGLPACLLFFWLVGCGVAPGLRALVSRADPPTEGVALGLVGFLLSAIFGHPLLVPLVGAGFFAALGLVSGLAGPPARRGSGGEAAGWMIAGMYLASLFWRW